MGRRRSLTCSLLLGVGLLTGCQTTPGDWTSDLPVAHSVRTAGFIIRSDFVIEDDAPLVTELEELQTTVRQTLELPAQRDPVVVYLFSSEGAYRRYMRRTWPSLPSRRAFFIGTSRELAVYSFHGPRVQEDLRHELTHGILHATLKTVPLWLDEGLAEYFEVRGATSGGPHQEHLKTLKRLQRRDWGPSIARLEAITDFEEFDREHYAEAWGWVHYLLHEDAAGREVLVDYLADLRDDATPGSLQARLPSGAGSAWKLTSHVRTLTSRPSESGIGL